MTSQPQAVTATSISIGGWMISVASNGNLDFASPQGSTFQMSQNGSLTFPGDLTGVQAVNANSINVSTVTASGAVTGGSLAAASAVVGGNYVITAGMPVFIWKPNDASVLNSSRRGDSFGKGWQSTPYYRNDTVDSDSVLRIGIVNSASWPFA